MRTIINEEENYSIKLKPVKKECEYTFYKGDNQLKILTGGIPIALTERQSIWKHILEYSKASLYNSEMQRKIMNNEIIPALQKQYNKIIFEEANNEKQSRKKEQREIIEKTNHEAKFWEYHIYRFGLIPILEEYLEHIALGDKVNIYSKLIHAFGVLIGEESYFQTTTAHAEAGKSYQDDILYNHYDNIGLIPEESIVILDEITKASFRNKGLIDPRCYDKKIIYAGDKGEDFDEELDKEVKGIVKRLITDKRSITEKDDGTGTSQTEHIELYADSIAWVENSVLNINKNDKGQRYTRSIYYTILPENNEKIMNFIGEIFSDKNGVLAWNFNQAFSLLKTFQSFLRKKVWDHENRDIIIPEYMRKYFIDLYKDKEFARREFKRHLIALRSFYELQTLNGSVVDDDTFKEYCELFINETTMPPLVNNLYLSIRDIVDVPSNVDSLLDGAVVACGLKHQIFDELENEFSWQPINYWVHVTDDREIQNVLKKLLQLYRLKNSNSDGKRYFFTTSDLRYRLKKAKSYKNVSDVSDALEMMQRNGLIDCLEEQVKINGNKYRIWYLLSC